MDHGGLRICSKTNVSLMLPNACCVVSLRLLCFQLQASSIWYMLLGKCLFSAACSQVLVCVVAAKFFWFLLFMTLTLTWYTCEHPCPAINSSQCSGHLQCLLLMSNALCIHIFDQDTQAKLNMIRLELPEGSSTHKICRQNTTSCFVCNCIIPWSWACMGVPNLPEPSSMLLHDARCDHPLHCSMVLCNMRLQCLECTFGRPEPGECISTSNLCPLVTKLQMSGMPFHWTNLQGPAACIVCLLSASMARPPAMAGSYIFHVETELCPCIFYESSCCQWRWFWQTLVCCRHGRCLPCALPQRPTCSGCVHHCLCLLDPLRRLCGPTTHHSRHAFPPPLPYISIMLRLDFGVFWSCCIFHRLHILYNIMPLHPAQAFCCTSCLKVSEKWQAVCSASCLKVTNCISLKHLPEQASDGRATPWLRMFACFENQIWYAGWWIWFYWLSPTAYSIYGLVGAQLGDVHDEYLTNFRGKRISVSDYLLNEFGLHHSFIGYAVLVLCGFIIFFRCVAILAMSRINFQKRWAFWRC